MDLESLAALRRVRDLTDRDEAKPLDVPAMPCSDEVRTRPRRRMSGLPESSAAP